MEETRAHKILHDKCIEILHTTSGKILKIPFGAEDLRLLRRTEK